MTSPPPGEPPEDRAPTYRPPASGMPAGAMPEGDAAAGPGSGPGYGQGYGPGYGPPAGMPPGPPAGPAAWPGAAGVMPPAPPPPLPPSVWRRPGYVVAGGVVVVGIVVAALLAFLPRGGWSDQTKNNFLSSCTSGSSEQLSPCRCVLDILQDRISEKDFLAEDARLRQGEDLSDGAEKIFRAAAAQCT